MNLKDTISKASKFNTILCCALLFLTLIGCEKNASSEVYTISNGTSFGMCAGYCIRELVVTTDATARYTATSWDTVSYPTLVLDTMITLAEWNDLMSLADLEVLKTFPAVVGCPDCADGGAEWISFDDGSQVKKVTIEYGDTLDGLGPIISRLAALRAEYEQRLFGDQHPERLIG